MTTTGYPSLCFLILTGHSYQTFWTEESNYFIEVCGQDYKLETVISLLTVRKDQLIAVYKGQAWNTVRVLFDSRHLLTSLLPQEMFFSFPASLSCTSYPFLCLSAAFYFPPGIPLVFSNFHFFPLSHLSSAEDMSRETTNIDINSVFNASMRASSPQEKSVQPRTTHTQITVVSEWEQG